MHHNQMLELKWLISPVVINSHVLNRYQKGYVLCKLIQHGSVALGLIILSANVEVNPSFMSLDDVKSIRGLQIAHLNVWSL